MIGGAGATALFLLFAVRIGRFFLLGTVAAVVVASAVVRDKHAGRRALSTPTEFYPALVRLAAHDFSSGPPVFRHLYVLVAHEKAAAES